MKKFATFALLVGFTGSMAGQAGQKEMPAPSTGKDMMKPMMVTGCVAQTGTTYTLDHAMMSSDMKGEGAKSADMKSKHMMSYMLMGGDLKGHVGHKVEVTGTLSKDSKPHDMAKDKMPNDATHKDATAMMGGTLQVKSVKMISAACP